LVMVDMVFGKEERELFVASSTRIDGATASTPLGQSWDYRRWMVREKAREDVNRKGGGKRETSVYEFGKSILELNGDVTILYQRTLSLAFCRATIPVLAQISLPFFCF